MQLIDSVDARRTALFSIASLGTAGCHDGLVTRASSEVAGYSDSFATTVVSPSIGARVDSATSGFSGGARYLADVVSTASPDIVATASPRWSETRHAGSAFTQYKPGALGVSAAGSFSYSPDYVSRGGTGAFLVDADDKHWSFSIGGGYNRDSIGRTNTPLSVFSRTLDVAILSGGATRIVDERTWVNVTTDVFVERGDPSKPYRYVPLFAPDAVSGIGSGASLARVTAAKILQPLEQLPLARDRVAVTFRIAHRFDRTTLRAEERVYGDTWGILASTTDVRLYLDAGERLSWGPSARANAQSGATFYSHAYTSTGPTDVPTFRTGDRELGPLVSASLGGRARYEIAGDGEKVGLAIGLLVDGTLTHFFQALYVTERVSGLGVLSLEARF